MNRLLRRSINTPRNDVFGGGFTLVELMVVVTISMMLVGGVALSVTKYLAGEKMSLAASQLVSVLDFARSAAITNQTPLGFTGLDYVAVTLTAEGKVEVWPVNNSTGIGTSYLSKNLNTSGISFTAKSVGDLQFAAGSGKLLGKNAAPSYVGYPLSSSASVGITVSSAEVSGTQQITISAFGAISLTQL